MFGYFSKILTLLQMKKEFTQKRKDINENCQILQFINFCIVCQLYICNKCTNHESHQKMLLDNIISTTTISTHLMEIYNHINIYCKE